MWSGQVYNIFGLRPSSFGSGHSELVDTLRSQGAIRHLFLQMLFVKEYTFSGGTATELY